ncbi:hypothetical protein N7535_007682 [Penicillium sp. DV-2018c]|nr:hypothetical protein N7461_003712 [Penicillium sp. DV-2018c]KAJ5566044.1 hypothetical protein N7535_007682 [Penicillium sp. DV-2018c]
MDLLALPNELLLIIAEHQDTQRDKNALARTNHRCHALLNPPLYAYNVRHHLGSALHWGASHGLFRTTQESLKQGADIESIDTQLDARPLILATRSDHADIVALLLEHGADPYAQRRGPGAFALAVTRKKAATLKAFLAHGVGPNHRNWAGYTPLHCAAGGVFGNYEAVVTALIEAGADLESTTPLGETPLQIACRVGAVDVVRCLVESGADCNQRHKSGKSLIHLAARSKQAGMVRVLVDAGADIEMRDDSGWTALHWACWDGKVETAEALLDAGADIEARTSTGHTPLILGVLWESTCYGSRLPLRMTPFLLKRGADVNAVNWSNVSPLHCAMVAAGPGLCEMLLLHGADPEVRTTSGLTPLHKAVQLSARARGVSSVQMRVLLNRGVDLQAIDNEGNTPLHDAACGVDPEVYELLLEAGASPLVKNQKGQWPAQLRRQWSMYEAKKKLREKHRVVSGLLEV